MNHSDNCITGQFRRKMLLGGLVAAASVLLRPDELLAAVTTPAAIPSNQVNLVDFGGVPGADPAAIISAFNQAFDRIKSLGGGKLNIAQGKYNFGNYSSAVNAIAVSDLKNVLISAYGAQLVMTTTATAMPVFMHFQNPTNVTIAGLSFYDFGTDLAVNWKGAICLSVTTSYRCSGFKTIDCTADNVVTFFRSYGNYTLTGCDISGTVKSSYYAVNPNYNGRFSKCNLICDRVRRGFIGYGARDWDITMSCNSASGVLGSNGFIDLVPDPSQPSENCTINLTVTGNTSPYGALVHFYHVHDATVAQYLRNVKANVILNNATGTATVFLFTHELSTGMLLRTLRTWEQVTLTGGVIGSYKGDIIRNPSVSIGTTNSILVSTNWSAYQDFGTLPSYFKTCTPSTRCGA
ncbi:MAG: hypothetical protein JWP57_4160 [Spirosoma sp.]|nr:hypothetical protein [Spirosoma sp.]